MRTKTPSRLLISAIGVLAAGGTLTALATPAAEAGRHAIAAPRTSVKIAAPATPIKHVVVLFMENQSFDSILGYWCDQNPGRCPDGGMPPTVKLSNGAVVAPGALPDTVPDVVHTVAGQKAALNVQHGVPQMNGWQNIPRGTCDAATGYRCVAGYKPPRIPNLTRLAQQFAISDHTFSVADSPSFEGHIAVVAQSSDGFYGSKIRSQKGVPASQGWGCDSKRVTQWVAPDGTLKTVPSCVPDPSLGLPFGGAFEKTPVKYIPTIMDRLNAAGLSWKIYGSLKGTKGYGIWDICPTFAECLYTGQYDSLVSDTQFVADAGAGALPAFSVVTPGGNDFMKGCHNGMSITACDNWVGQLVGAVEKSPDWSSTAVFLTFDDCGGFYDQVPPPLEADGTQEGPRVPMIIISPYAKPGYTDTTATTFAGILAYTEHNFGLKPLGVNDANAYDFKNAFNYSQAPLKPARMITRRLPPSAKRLRLTPELENDPT